MSAPMFVARTAELLIPNLIAHWPMNEGSGTTINDISGSGFNGTINGATWTTPGYTGSGPVLSFDGIDDYVEFGNIFYHDAFSVSMRLRTTTVTALKIALLKRNTVGTVSAATNQFAFQLEANGTFNSVYWDAVNAADGVQSVTALTVNTWYHVVSTRSITGDGHAVYINGTPNATLGQYITMVNSNSSVQIGPRSANNNTRYWSGFIQDVRIYSRALTSTEVAAIYNGDFYP